MIALAKLESPPSLMTEIRWNWDWSAGTTVLLAAAVVAWIVTVYAKEQAFVGARMRMVLAALRLVAAAAVIVMLGQPTVERSRVVPPRVAVLVDESASMDTQDVPAAELPQASGATGAITRREAWESLLTGGESPVMAAIRDQFQVDVVRFAGAPELASDDDALRTTAKLAPDRDATRLGDAIDFALRDMPGPRPAAVIAMTDGVNTGGMPLDVAADRARILGVPLHTVAIGSDAPRPDVAIEDVLVEDVVFPGDRLQLEASVRSTGYAGQKAAVVLKRAGTEESLAETQVELPADGEPTTVRLALRPSEPGPMPLVVEAEGRAGEDDLANNRVELTLDVRDRPIRTLLVDSSPSFEFRALKSLLERDPAIDLRVWLQDADADYADVDEASLRAFPATEADWLEYDVVILGDVDPELLPRQTWDLLHKFVSMHGGGLVLIAGQRHTPRALADREAMQSLLPIDVSGQSASPSSAPTTAGVRVTPTSAGLRDAMLQLGDTMEESLAIWRELPPLLWFYEPLRVKPGVQILATTASESGDAASQPVIMRHYVGAGEVLMHATDETWRWRWRNDDRYFARYWGQAVRRLARVRATRGVGSLSTNRTEYQPGDPVTIRLRLGAARDQAGAAQTIELLGHSTPTREIRLRRRGAHARIFEATLHDLPADRYTARVGGSNSGEPSLSTEFTISAPPSELSRLAVNTAGLQAAAKATGGKFYTTKTAARLPEELPAARPTAVERLPEEPLWNSHGLLAVVCVALAAEWFLRRRSGLL